MLQILVVLRVLFFVDKVLCRYADFMYTEVVFTLS